MNVVDDDTDILVLLMYHWKQNMASIIFSFRGWKKLKIWRISDLVGQAGPIVTSYLLFLHVWSGWDRGLIKKLKQSKEVQTIEELMMDHNAMVEQVREVGVWLYLNVSAICPWDLTSPLLMEDDSLALLTFFLLLCTDHLPQKSGGGFTP